MADLLKLGTGMFPNRLIVGELSGPEALYTLQAMNSGYSGMTLIHATSPEDALSRLEAMCIMANLGLGLSEIRSLIASAIDLVTYQEQLPNGSRKLTQVAQLKKLDGNRYNLEPIFRYDATADQFIHTGYKPDWIE